jgi:hypothetical protein
MSKNFNFFVRFFAYRLPKENIFYSIRFNRDGAMPEHPSIKKQKRQRLYDIVLL